MRLRQLTVLFHRALKEIEQFGIKLLQQLRKIRGGDIIDLIIVNRVVLNVVFVFVLVIDEGEGTNEPAIPNHRFHRRRQMFIRLGTVAGEAACVALVVDDVCDQIVARTLPALE